VTDYLFNAGADTYIAPPYQNPPRRGPIGFGTHSRFAEFTDGLSQTFVIGEAAGGNQANRLYAVGAGANRTCVPLTAGYTYGGMYSYNSVYYDNLMFMAYGRWGSWVPARWGHGRLRQRLEPKPVADFGAGRRPSSASDPLRPGACGQESTGRNEGHGADRSIGAATMTLPHWCSTSLKKTAVGRNFRHPHFAAERWPSPRSRERSTCWGD
jgi:hypothetical protein